MSEQEKAPCPRDTNGDGDCGQRYCPHCGVQPDEARIEEPNPDEEPLPDSSWWRR